MKKRTHATVSLGVGFDGASFEEDFNYASMSVEMALSRGGDQAVTRNRINFEFYGGRGNEVETRTKVKSRVVANALVSFIKDASTTYIMRCAELGLVHRHELSGALHGLFRVRCFTQDDAHIFMTRDQMKDEIQGVVRLFDEVYSQFGLPYKIELSTMQNGLTSLCTKYNVTDNLSATDLRNAFIRRCIQSEIDLYSLCQYIGIKQPNVIIKHFGGYFVPHPESVRALEKYTAGYNSPDSAQKPKIGGPKRM